MGKSSDLLNPPQIINIKGINELTPNWIKKHSDPNLQRLCIFNRGVESLSLKKNLLPIIHLQDEKREINNYFKDILREYRTKHAGYQGVISSILQAVIIKISRLLKDSDHHSFSPVCLEIKKYIEGNFKQQLTLNDLANLVYVSPYHLDHVFIDSEWNTR